MVTRPFFGVVHLPASPSGGGGREPTVPDGGPSALVDRALDVAIRDARALRDGGVDGIVIENFGDAPFRKGTAADPVAPDVPAVLAVVARAVRAETDLPIAINCLRNDGMAALAAAAVAGAEWIRVNVWSGSYVTDQGVIDGEAARVLAYRRQLAAPVRVLADHCVKHARPLAELDPIASARDLAQRSGAAGLVLTGTRTGDAVDAGLLRGVKAAVGSFPVWIGSGLTVDNAPNLWPMCDGAIVGTALKVDGMVSEPVDPARVERLRAALR